MVLSWRRKARWPIGCAFSDREVRLAQLRIARGRASMQIAHFDIASDEPPNTDAWRATATAALREALAAGDLRGPVVTCLPLEQMYYRHLRLPPIPNAEMSTAVQWRTAKELGQSVDDLCTDFFEVGEALESGKQRQEVVAASALQRAVEAHVSMVTAANCEVDAVDAGASALARCLSTIAPGEPRFVIDIGATRTALMVVHGGEPRFVRCVEVGRSTLVDRAMEQGSLAEEDRPLVQRVFDSPSEAVDAGDANAVAALQSLRHVFAAFAEDLAHEAKLCMHYLGQARLTALQADTGCIVGAGGRHDATMAELSTSTAITFRPLHELLPPQVAGLLEDLPAGATLDEWLLPIGMAMYGREHLLQRKAA